MPAPTAGTASATLATLKFLLTLVYTDRRAPDVINAACNQATVAIADAESKLAGQPHPTCFREALDNIQAHWMPDARLWPVAADRPTWQHPTQSGHIYLCLLQSPCLPRVWVSAGLLAGPRRPKIEPYQGGGCHAALCG
ncbi:hypothetical protein B9Y72_07285 [Stenotrophomonas maltophilia]|nr:hypothetical protein B9Y68_07285 [Stenotrophomonas maltophilia]PJL21631.1 hypothetical protein B9Y72_07285 [Stenotrophomonas maltophilia]